MILDIILIILLSLGFYAGYVNGVFGVALKIILFFASILLALKLFPVVFLFMENTFADLSLIYFIVGFLLVLVVIMLLYRFVSKKIEQLVRSVSARLITRISGGVILAMFLLILCSFIIARLISFKVAKPEMFESSELYPMMKATDQAFRGLVTNIRETLNNTFEHNVKTINEIDQK